MLTSLLWLSSLQFLPLVRGDLGRPLIFDFVATEPARVKVFWDPNIRVGRVLELSNRDVSLVRDNVTGALGESFGDWHILVTERDGDEGDRRYVFLKKTLCHEVDWRVAWEDAEGARHGPLIQRLGSSPSPWAPDASIDVLSTAYDASTDAITLEVAMAVRDEGGLSGKLSEIRVVAELKGCESMFRSPVRLPVSANNTVLLPGAYGRHFCTLWLRLAVDTLNEEGGCRELLLTTDEVSTEANLYCHDIPGMGDSCQSFGEPAQSLDCEMDCQPDIRGAAQYRYDGYGIATPYVEIKWIPRIADRPVSGFIVRHAQIDRNFNNFPMKEFNVTVERLGPGQFSADFDQYTRDLEASYGVQACVLYSECKAGVEPDWQLVPQRQVSFNELISELPAPTTVAPPTQPPSPPPPASTRPYPRPPTVVPTAGIVSSESTSVEETGAPSGPQRAPQSAPNVRPPVSAPPPTAEAEPTAAAAAVFPSALLLLLFLIPMLR